MTPLLMMDLVLPLPLLKGRGIKKHLPYFVSVIGRPSTTETQPLPPGRYTSSSEFDQVAIELHL